MKTFAAIVEDVNSLSDEEIVELENIIQKLLIERRRDEIAQNHSESLIDYKKGKLKSFDNTPEAIQYLKNL